MALPSGNQGLLGQVHTRTGLWPRADEGAWVQTRISIPVYDNAAPDLPGIASSPSHRGAAIINGAQRGAREATSPVVGLEPTKGILGTSGYGLRIAGKRGHLVLSDGIGQWVNDAGTAPWNDIGAQAPGGARPFLHRKLASEVLVA